MTTTPPVASSQHSVVSRQKSEPAPSLRSPAPTLAGRETELAQLHRWLAKALSGERQIVFIAGEAGVGKTTIIDAFLHSLESRVQSLKSEDQNPPLSLGPTLDPRRQTLDLSPWIARGQCVDHYGAGEPYMPMLEALGRLCRGPDGKRLIALLNQCAPTWLVQMPALLNTSELGAQLCSGLHAIEATGTVLARPYYLALLSEVYGKAGQFEKSLSVLQEALVTAHTNDDRFYEAEVWRLQGEMVLQKSKASLG